MEVLILQNRDFLGGHRTKEPLRLSTEGSSTPPTLNFKARGTDVLKLLSLPAMASLPREASGVFDGSNVIDAELKTSAGELFSVAFTSSTLMWKICG